MNEGYEGKRVVKDGTKVLGLSKCVDSLTEMGGKLKVSVRCREWKSCLDSLRSPNVDAGWQWHSREMESRHSIFVTHTDLRAPALHELAKGVHGCAWRQSRKIHNKWNN